MTDIRVKDLTEATAPGADYYLLTDSATDGVKKVKTTNVVKPADIGAGATASPLSQFAATTSAQLAGVISDETGTGALVFATSPTLVAPTLGIAAATSLNKVAITTPATGSTLTLADGVTLAASANATVSGTNTGDQTITLTGDVTGTGTGSFAATISANAVTNAKMATMGAFTFKGNATGAAAAPADVDIAALTTKASPAAGDYIMLSDQAASGAWKKATVSSVASASSAVSVITPEQYGAVGNGSTNDTTALQNFLNALSTTNSIGICAPGKTYMFGTQAGGLFVKSNTKLIGNGATFKALDTALQNYSSLNITDATQGAAGGPSFVTIEGLTVNGNATARRAASVRTVTITIASPAVASLTNHGFIAGKSILFSTSGALPTGVTAGTVYYVIAAGLTANSFEFSTTVGGSAVNTSGTQSGTHGVSSLVVGDAASFYCVNATHITIRDCLSFDSEADGFYFGGDSTTGGPGFYFEFDGCYATGSSRNAYSVVGGNRGSLVNCIAADISYGAAHANISNGFDFEPNGSTSTNDAVDCIGCKAILCAEGFGVHNLNSYTTNVNWVSCIAESCTVGFAAGTAGSNVKIIGARTSGNGTDFSNCFDVLRKEPTRQVFTSGSGTYTAPANVTWIEVEMVGGGGGGAGGGSGGTNSTAGGNTTFSTLTANGGGATTSQVIGGAGGTGSGGDYNVTGQDGAGAGPSNVAFGGAGGATTLSGAGPGGAPGAFSAGGTAKANTGSGGGGGSSNNAANNVGAGGGAGGYVQKIIAAPAATYSYAVGAAGSAGSAGTGGTAGGAGAAGIIRVTEHYSG